MDLVRGFLALCAVAAMLGGAIGFYQLVFLAARRAARWHRHRETAEEYNARQW